MKKLLFVILGGMLSCVILLGGMAVSEAQVKSTPEAPVAAEAPQPELRDLSRREARQLGLTIREITSIARELKSAGLLTGDRETDAEMILSKAIERNPKAFADPALDWDAILAFIERILPLILTILSLF